MTYELAIIGGGPAAAAAAVYAARKRLNTVMIAEEIGGQSVVSDTIYNWIGTPEISGPDLAKNLRTHIESYTTEGNTLTLKVGDRVTSITKELENYTITASEHVYTAKTVLIATGSRRRALTIPGADTFEHKGVMYCATCDGPLFGGQALAVIGGGNAAFEAVLQLAQYATHVTLFNRSDKFRADEITIQEVLKLPNASIRTNIDLVEIKGAQFANALSFKDVTTGEVEELPVGGIFVEIGQLPNTDLVKDVVTLDTYNKIIVDPLTQRTSEVGIWAAGDCTNGLYHQNNIAVGDAVKAIEDLYIWLKTNK